MSNPHYVISTDGGSRAHGTESLGYGSYHIRARDGRENIVRLDFGPGITNNVAEYKTLIAALTDLLGRIEGVSRRPSDFAIVARTDSQLVVGQVAGGWKVKQPHLRPLRDEAKLLLARFHPSSRLEKAPRTEIEAILGH
jgi:ribonuclease HI